jgi:hypothetical protein
VDTISTKGGGAGRENQSTRKNEHEKLEKTAKKACFPGLL